MKKIQSQKGFSIPEMLMAVLIMTLTLSFIGGGVTVIKDAYLKITIRKEAQILLSTVITAVSRELQYADDIQKADGYWNFYNIERGYRMSFENQNNNIYIKSQVGEEEKPLLTDKLITSGLIPKIKDLTYINQVFTYKIEIYYKDEVLAKQEISVRPMNAD